MVQCDAATPPKLLLNTFPLTISITSPTNGSYVYHNKTTTIQASASDNLGIMKVEFYVNNALTCTVTATPYSCAWRVPRNIGIIYNLQAKGYDSAGNSAASAIITVTSK